jgi:hypothetical protein
MRVEPGSFAARDGRDGSRVYLHHLDGTTAAASPPPPPPNDTAPQRADPDTLHAVYSALLARLSLSQAHREALRRRGLADDAIDRAGYRTLPVPGRARIARDLRERFGDAVLRVPGVAVREQDGRRFLSLGGSAGLLIPARAAGGRIAALLVRRDGGGDWPRYSYLSSAKYGGPGPGAPVHVPRGLTTPCPCVRVTEGALKADIAYSLSGLPTIGLAGASAWRPGPAALQALGCQTVRLAYDADARIKPAVARPLAALAEAVAAAGLAVELERWGTTHKGIDDALAAGAAVEVLAGVAARQAIAEIVAAAGVALRRPAPARRRDRIAFTMEV